MDPAIVGALIQVATPYLADTVRTIGERISKEAPPVIETQEGPVLTRPDRRLSVGLSFFDKEKVVPTIFVEKEGSWAHSKAEALASDYTGEIDVVVRGIAHSAWPKDPVTFQPSEPIRPGASVGHYRGYAGSLGCIVRDNRSPKSRAGFIGAAHVLSILNRAVPGDDVIRPGYPDGPKARRNRIGRLDTFSYLGYYEREVDAVISPNDEDVALVLLDDEAQVEDVSFVPDPDSSGRVKKVTSVVPTEELLSYRGQVVFKMGRSSKLTTGRVVGLEEQCPITLPDRRPYLYSQTIQVERTGSQPFSEPGDSGALVYTDDLKGLGLIIGGNDRFSWVTPLSKCLDAVDVQLAT